MPLPVRSVWRRFGGAVDRDEEIGLALSGTGLGDIDMQIAQRIVLEGLFLTARLRARQLADAVALEEAGSSCRPPRRRTGAGPRAG